jgi:glycosyltransferase involved in cell wall biosynthesis
MLENHHSKISIIIPMYNRATLVGKTLDSVLVQTYTDWECIVVDDGSADNSVEIVQKYIDKDSRFKLLIRPDHRIKGAPTCRNIGFENSNGEFIYFFDSDDILTPRFCEVAISELENYPESDFAIVPYDLFTDSPINSFLGFGSLIKGKTWEQLVFQKVLLSTQSFIFRRNLFEQSEMLWREGQKKYQDADFITRQVAISNGGIVLDMNPMNHIRRHQNSISCQVKNSDIHFISILINAYSLYQKNNKMTLQNKIMFMQGFLNMNIHYAIKTYNRNIAWNSYQFIRKHCCDIRQQWKFRYLAYLTWLFVPILYIIGKTIVRYRHTYLIIVLRKLLRI